MCLYAYREEGSLLPTYYRERVSSPLVLELSPFSNIPSPKLSNEKPGLRIPWPDRPTDQPPPTRPPARPLSGQCTPNRHIWTKSNRILSKRFPRPPLQSPSTGGRKPYARRFSTKAGLSPPPPRLLSMEKWKPFLWISSLSLSISLFPLLFLGRGGSVIRTGRGQECCCAIFRWMYRIFNGRIGSIFYLRKNLSVSLSLSLARIISDDFDSPLQKRTSPNAWNQFNIYIYISNRKKKENSSSFSTSV